MKQSVYIDCRGKSEDYVKECCKELERLGHELLFEPFCFGDVKYIVTFEDGDYCVSIMDYPMFSSTQITLEELRTLKNNEHEKDSFTGVDSSQTMNTTNQNTATKNRRIHHTTQAEKKENKPLSTKRNNNRDSNQNTPTTTPYRKYP